MISYADAMVGYFSFFGLGTLAFDPMFGPQSILGLSYFFQPQNAMSHFFIRCMGVMLLSMPVGYLKFGFSKESFIKQTLMWHLLTAPLFIGNVLQGEAFNPTIWGLQVAANLLLTIWGYSSLEEESSKKK